jgi:cytochrome c
MSRSSPPLVLAAISIGVSLSAGTAAERLNIGRSVSPEDLAAWDIDVRADGTGLPAGRGSVKQGQEVYASNCAVCHGDKGEGRRVEGAVGGFDRLVGGFGTLTRQRLSRRSAASGRTPRRSSIMCGARCRSTRLNR